MNRPGNARILATSLAAAAALSAGILLAPGCSKPPTLPPDAGGKPGDANADPWDAAAKRLRKDADVAAARTALGQLNSDLANRRDVPGPAALSKEAEAALTGLVPLNPGDLEDVRSGTYTGLDPVYVADGYYLRDAARALDLGGLPPADQARLAFAWVCRQVALNPWLQEVQPGVFQATALPPTHVLRRGHGSGLERAYVFLALLQQMGLDGCLVGPAAAADLPAGYVAYGPDKQPLTGTPKGPFWAVGARVGADVLLFEPWRGEPFPGPGGKGVGTLAQAKASPDQFKAWLDDKAWGVTADDLKAGWVFLAVPVSGLSPRMAMLDEKLKPEGSRLAVDPLALRDRFRAAPPNGPGVPAGELKFWNPPNDRFAYGRAAATFLPVEEGGTDRAERGRRLFDEYQRALLPPSVLSLPPELTAPLAIDRLVQLAAGSYYAAFFTPPTPRERIQRGQYQDATGYLTGLQERFAKGTERLRRADPGEVEGWVTEANRLYAELTRARSFDPGAVPAAQAAVDQFWQIRGPTAQLIVDLATARVGWAEATYLTALTKHEEAERQQVRADRAAGPEADRAKAAAARAWKEAEGAWDAYHGGHAAAQAGLPGRLAHAKALADRAKALAGRK